MRRSFAFILLVLSALLPAWAGAAVIGATDVAGLRAAITVGNTVVLPAGDFDLGATPLVLPPGVRLQGAGMGRTRILTNAGSYLWMLGENTEIHDLTVLHQGTGNDQVLKGNGGGSNAGLVLDHVELDENTGTAPAIGTGARRSITYCVVSSTSTDGHGPLTVSGGTGLVFSNNVVSYRTGRLKLVFQTGMVACYNSITVDGAQWTSSTPETGGLEASYGAGNLVLGNSFRETNPAYALDNCRELYIEQNGNVGDWWGQGSVVSAAGTTLVTTMRWGGDDWYDPQYPITRRKVLFVLSGAAAGQWRYASRGVPDGRVLVSSPIAGLSPSDSVAVSSIASLQTRTLFNTFKGGTIGSEWYIGAIGSEMGGNAYSGGSSGVQVRADTRIAARTPNTTTQFGPLWGCSVYGSLCFDGAGVAWYDYDVSNTGLPLTILGYSVYGNSVTPTFSYLNQITGSAVSPAGRRSSTALPVPTS